MSKPSQNRARLLAASFLGLSLSFALSEAALAAPNVNDPLEGANRTLYRVEGGLDRALLRPLSVFYSHALPRPVRAGLMNLAANLEEPAGAVNDLLQGRAKRAGQTAARFALNTTVGLGGVIDVATRVHLPHHANDFGLTLARYGVGPGPYLYLPLLGPSNVRDGAARIVSAALNPLTYLGYPGQAGVSVGAAAASGLDQRAAADGQLKALNDGSLDPYATLRAYAQQSRQSAARDGIVEIETLPSFDEADVSPPAAPRPALAIAAQGGGQ